MHIAIARNPRFVNRETFRILPPYYKNVLGVGDHGDVRVGAPMLVEVASDMAGGMAWTRTLVADDLMSASDAPRK